MPITDAHLRSLADAEPVPFWLDTTAPEAGPTLAGTVEADLVVVGGGYTGLWTALMAKERDPSRSVVLLEAHRMGSAASGRNGGFCSSSLTHGLANGLSRWPDEIAELERQGLANLDDIEATLTRYGIDAELERTGEITVATQPWHLEGGGDLLDPLRRFGHDAEWLDADALQAHVHSPTYLGGLWDKSGTALVNPAKLAWGLSEAARSLGVDIYEDTPAVRLEKDGAALRVQAEFGSVRTDRVALATNAFPSLLRRVKHYIVPVWDYVLMTEPLTPAQHASIGWDGREGLSDAANQFHYYRLSADNRILWGGYDAVYYAGGRVAAEKEHRAATYMTLAKNFFTTFPQLADVGFSHRWGGVIDTCSRFSPFWGQAYGGRVAYVVGYTGLGVAATRFGANVMLDLLGGERTERTALRMVTSKPLPFPPEPVRTGVVQLTRHSIAAADANEGRRNLWLQTLDRLGLGFDS
ncbi:MAG: FAD-dependent oxidoreductase [Jiangellales bacterium]